MVTTRLRARLAGTIWPAGVSIALANAVRTCAFAGAVMGATLLSTVGTERTTPARLAYTGALAAHTMPIAVVGARARFAANTTEASIAGTLAIIAFAVAAATQVAHESGAVTALKARHAVALIVLAVAARRAAVFGAKFFQAVIATETRLAEAYALLTFAVATTVSRAFGLAVLLVEAFITVALAIYTLAMTTAVLRAHLDRTVTPIKALVARARTIQAHTPERTVVGTRYQATIAPSEARAAQALTLL